MNAMSGVSAGNFKAFAQKFDFSKYKTLCDVGAATGQLSCMVAAANPHMRCTSFDVPKVLPLATRKIKEAGLTDRVTAVSGDFFADPLPNADVITMGMILHDWNLEKKKALIRKARPASMAIDSSARCSSPCNPSPSPAPGPASNSPSFIRTSAPAWR